MSVYGISSTSSTAATDTSGNTTSRMPQKTLGQEEFFKLIATQLASQDPLKPMEDTSFIAQLANFSALENSTQLVAQFEKFTGQQEITSAQNLLGRTVSLTDPYDGNVTGVVTAVDSTDDGIFITVNGMDYEVGTVRRVELTENNSSEN